MKLTKLLQSGFFKKARRGRRAARRPWFSVEVLEDRVTPSATPGLTLSGSAPPSWNMLYDGLDQPAVSPNPDPASQYYTGAYQQPGFNGYQGAPFTNQNTPYIINGSPSFDQPVQSSDWWSPLMFRFDPSAPGNLPYANSDLASDPTYVRFINSQLAPGLPAIQGLGINNPGPNDFAIDPGPVTSTTDSSQTVYVPSAYPLIVGISGDVKGNGGAGSDTPAQEITPLGVAGADPSTSTLNVRVNSYSDWGVQVAYGNGNPDVAGSATDSLAIDMLNGSPFTYFTKTATDPNNWAYTKVWLDGTSEANSDGTQAVNVVWGRGGAGVPADETLPQNVLGVTLTTYFKDQTGTLLQNTTSYLVIASDPNSSWSLDTTQTPHNPAAIQLYKNDMANGTIVAVALPSYVDNTPFESLSLKDQVGVANLFIAAAGNVPVSNPAATQVSDPTAHTETYDGAPVTFGYDQSTGLITTKYTVTTQNGGNTFQVLYPAQYKNLLPGDQGHFLTYNLNGTPVGLTYSTLRGTAKVYDGNQFATQLQYHGVLNYLPSVAVQTSAQTAQALYDDAATWMTRYLPDPNSAIGATENTYQVGLNAMSQELLVIDQLASPASALPAAEQNVAAQWRDRLLQDLEGQLFSWFDLSTGRLFQLNTKYDTVIGYPAGFGSDFSINDHHFHYGYFLTAFATVAQFDPSFTKSMLPQIELLIDDVANFSHDGTLPFLREFNPYEGHSWADGVGLGTNNEEAASEAVNFYSGMVELGMALGRSDWVSEGAYLYQTEIEAMNEYWFNTSADPANGNPGNWPARFSDYIAQVQQGNDPQLVGEAQTVTQIANVQGNADKRALFFNGPNYAEATYAINWLPTTAAMLFLGSNQAYAQRNWAQFVTDYQLDGGEGNYEAVVAAYQALMPDSGFGVNQPGPTNALLRLDATLNPAIAPPNRSDPITLGYRGTSRTIALNWIYELQALGQVDYSVVADAVSYAVFVNNGQRTYVAYNPTAAPLTVTFRDAQSGQSLLQLVVAPGETVTRLPSGQLIIDEAGRGKVAGQGTALYLTKPLDNNPNNTQGSLSLTPGTAVPATPANDTQAGILAAYANTYMTVPKRPGGPTENGDNAPSDGSAIASFTISGINGSYVPGGQTGIELFLDNVLTWAEQQAPDAKFGNQFGPGVLQNQSFGHPDAVVEVDYDFNGSGTYQRVETYVQPLSDINQFNIFDTTTPVPGVLAPDTPDTLPVLNPSLSDLAPFQNMQNGSVRIRVWAGQFSVAAPGGVDNSNKEFAVSVNTVARMARSSRVYIPYTDAAPRGPVTVAGISAVTPNPRNAPVGTVTVTLTGPADPASFTAAALTLTRDGTAVSLSGVTVVPLSGGQYAVHGLAPLQAADGTYVLTVNGAAINNQAGQPGSGSAQVTWDLTRTGPVTTLSSTAPPDTDQSPIPVTVEFSEPVTDFTAGDVTVANASLSNFRGAGDTYSFDLTPSGPGVTVTATVAAGVAHDAAGNPNEAASLTRQFTFAGPTVALSSTAPDTTDLTAFQVTAVFSGAVNGFTAADLVVSNGTVSHFAGLGKSYTFLVTPGQPGPVTVSVPAGVASDTRNNPNAASAPLVRTLDNAAPTGFMTSITHFDTYEPSIPVAVQFSEPVTGFDASKVVAGNATVANFAGSGSRYSFDLIPNGIGVVTADVAAGAGHDAAGNPSAALPQFSRDFEVIPSFTIALPVTSPTSRLSVLILVTFNEPVTFDSSKISIGNGSVVGSVTQIGAGLYTFNVKPASAGPVTVNVPPAAAVDSFGNSRKGNALTYTFTYGPSPQVTFSAQPQNAYYFVTATFTTPVVGFDPTELVVPGANATITSFSGSGAVYNFRVTPKPAAGHYGPETMALDLPAGAVRSPQGVPNLASSGTIDAATTGPTVITTTTALVGADGNAVAAAGATIPMTVTFSEPVNGFAAGKLIPINATVSNFTGKDGDAVYTFNLVPDAGATFATLVINPAAPPPAVTSLAGVAVMAPPADFRVNYTTAPLVTGVTSSAPNGNYAAGATIPIEVTFSAPVDVKGSPQLLLATGGTGPFGVATYASGSGTATLTFDYTVQPGQSSPRLDYAAASALSVNASIGEGIFQTGSTTPAVLSLPAPGASGSLAATKDLAIGPTVTSVTKVSSSVAPGVYGAGTVIPITVQFTAPVTVTGTPHLKLSDGGSAVYTSGSGTATLTFTYTVASGQNALHLDYASSTALVLGPGDRIDQTNSLAGWLNSLPVNYASWAAMVLGFFNLKGPVVPANLTLPAPGSPGSLGADAAIAIKTAAPKVVYVTAGTAPATYAAGATVPIRVGFDSAVTVTGTPELLLAAGKGSNAVAQYVSGSGSNVLTFRYTVAAGDDTTSLDYRSATALTLNGGTVEGPTGLGAVLTLPAPGAPGSLGNSNSVAVLAVAPQATTVYSRQNGSFGQGEGVTIYVNFSTPVQVKGGTPTLALSDGGVATLLRPLTLAAFNTTLVFGYVPGGPDSGQNSPHLDYASSTALSLNGATITDAAGNNLNPALPAPGAPGSLASNNFVVIQTDKSLPPSVAGVTSPVHNGTYAAGAVIPIEVTFSRRVVATGTPVLALATGGGANDAVATYVGGSGGYTLTFDYTVAAGQHTPNLDYASTAALSGGTIVDKDTGKSANPTLPAPGPLSPGSLGANRKIVIQAQNQQAPAVLAVRSSAPNWRYAPGDVIPILVTFGEAVVVGGKPLLRLADGGIARYVGGSGTTTLIFDYTVRAGQSSPELDYASTKALTLSPVLGHLRRVARPNLFEGEGSWSAHPASGADHCEDR
jgi:hypothetical protein